MDFMRDFWSSTLWRISAFNRMRESGEADALQGNTRPTLLPTTLLADLRQLAADPATNDVLEVMAACVRQREAALLYLGLGPYVWPVTLFPLPGLYHSPRDVLSLPDGGELSRLTLIGAERPGVLPPGHTMHERVAALDKYRPLAELFAAVALRGPRTTLLTEIGGRAAYRLAAGRADQVPALPGALGPAVARLRHEAVSLRDIARWPGMSLERASRMLNALYLTETLMVTRSHPAARNEPAQWRDLLGRRR
jgi:hypothetical protein